MTGQNQGRGSHGLPATLPPLLELLVKQESRAGSRGRKVRGTGGGLKDSGGGEGRGQLLDHRDRASEAGPTVGL